MENKTKKWKRLYFTKSDDITVSYFGLNNFKDHYIIVIDFWDKHQDKKRFETRVNYLKFDTSLQCFYILIDEDYNQYKFWDVYEKEQVTSSFKGVMGKFLYDSVITIWEKEYINE